MGRRESLAVEQPVLGTPPLGTSSPPARRSSLRRSSKGALVPAGSHDDRLGYFAGPPETQLLPDVAPSDPFLAGPLTEEAALELRAFAVSAEADSRHDEAAMWYGKELRVWMKLSIEAGEREDIAELRRTVLELLTCCEAQGRCYSLTDNNDAALKCHRIAVKHARIALPDDHPVVAGSKVFVADCLTIIASECEERRARLDDEPQDSERRRAVGSEEWRLQVVAARNERDDHLAEARNMYKEAALSYRVAAAMMSDPHGSRLQGRGEHDVDTSPNGCFGAHVAHCLSKISEGYGMSGYIDKAFHFQQLALETYHAFAHDDPPTLQGAPEAADDQTSQDPSTRSLHWTMNMPYLSGFEYDPRDFDSDAVYKGDGSRIRALLSSVDSCLDTQQVTCRYNTWVPTVLEIEDALDDNCLEMQLEAAEGRLQDFMQAIEEGDRERWLSLLRESPLVVFLGVAARPVTPCPDARKPVIVSNCPFVEAITRRTSSALHEYEHLAFTADLSPGEVAKCHGLDWERSPIEISFPLLAAVKSRDRIAVTLLLDLGCDPTLCSPHDMRTPLAIALDNNDLLMAELLLQHPQVFLDAQPEYELRAERKGAVFSLAVEKVPMSPEKQRTFHSRSELPFATFFHLVLCQPEHKALAFFDRHSWLFLSRLHEHGTADQTAMAFKEGQKLHSRLERAISDCLMRSYTTTCQTLLYLLPTDQKHAMLCHTDHPRLVKLLLSHPDVDVNMRVNGRFVVSYHIERSSIETLELLCNHPKLDEHILSADEREKIDTLIKRWG